MYSAIFLVVAVVQLVNSQHSIELQFIGSEISEKEQSELDICETKYCTLDSDYLFLASTQNKSVKPCEDFKEFAVGTFAKFSVPNDRWFAKGFLSDVVENYQLRIKRVLSAKVDVNDTRITKTIKNLYAKCVKSEYIRRNGVNEAREYLLSLGLKFYPDTDQDVFNLSQFIEEQPAHVIHNFFNSFVARDLEGLLLRRAQLTVSAEIAFGGYEDLLYEMFQVYRNSSNDAVLIKKQFHEIYLRQKQFYESQQSFVANVSLEGSGLMSIDELNNLTASLNLDWSRILKNLLVTKLNDSEKIYVESPERIRKLAEFLASYDRKLIAEYLAYYILFSNSELVQVYRTDKFFQNDLGIKKSQERWQQCMLIFLTKMNPAVMWLYSQKYANEKLISSVKEFMNEAKEFVVKKIKSEARWDKKVNEDLVYVASSISFVAGYPEKFLKSEKVEELFALFPPIDDQNFAKSIVEIRTNFEKTQLEAPGSELRQIFAISQHTAGLRYLPDDHAFFLDYKFLHYPFYHHERPRFFNSATIPSFYYRKVRILLDGYVKATYNVTDFDILNDIDDNDLQLPYEFYNDWLKSGKKDLQLGAHRLTDQQLFWVAAARALYYKIRPETAQKIEESAEALEKFHDLFYSRLGFREAFHCK